MKLGYEIPFIDDSVERLIAEKECTKLVLYSDVVIDLEEGKYIKSRDHEKGEPVHPDVLQNFQWAKEIEDPQAAADRIERKRDRMEKEN